jgi:RHS repeat-associated protein
VTDAGGNVVVGQRYYAPYGQRLSGGADSESVGFTGEREDLGGGESNLVYLHARYYDPILGRFISPDPSLPAARLVGLNHYAYAENDPINYGDTSGFMVDSGDGGGGDDPTTQTSSSNKDNPSQPGPDGANEENTKDDYAAYEKLQTDAEREAFLDALVKKIIADASSDNARPFLLDELTAGTLKLKGYESFFSKVIDKLVASAEKQGIKLNIMVCVSVPKLDKNGNEIPGTGCPSNLAAEIAKKLDKIGGGIAIETNGPGGCTGAGPLSKEYKARLTAYVQRLLSDGVMGGRISFLIDITKTPPPRGGKGYYGNNGNNTQLARNAREIGFLAAQMGIEGCVIYHSGAPVPGLIQRIRRATQNGYNDYDNSGGK